MRKTLIHISICLIFYWPNSYAQKIIEFSFLQSPLLLANAGNDTTVVAGSSVILGAVPAAIGGSGSFTYQWEPVQLFDNPYAEHPLVIMDTSAAFILTVSDSRGCSSTDSVTIYVATLGTGSGVNNPGDILIQPNPVQDDMVLNIQGFDTRLEVMIFFISPSGVVLIQEDRILEPKITNTYYYNIEHFPAGNYLIRIMGENMDNTNRIIKF